MAAYVEHYNHVRLNSAIDYLTPADKLNGLAQLIFDERIASWRKLASAASRHAKRYGRLLDAACRATTDFGLGGE